MTQYYFLATLLPPLKYGEENEMSFQDFKDLLILNLKPKDLLKFQVLLRFYDWVNLRAFWKKQALGFVGNWDEHFFETLAADEEGIPDYLIEFLETYPTKEEQIQHFSYLLIKYYREKVEEGFLSWWLKFEGGMRLNLTAIRAQVGKRSLEDEVIFQDKEDEEIQDIRANVASSDFHPKEPFSHLLDIYISHYKEPMELDQALDRFRFKAVEDKINFDHFSIDYILGYAVLFFMNLKFTLRNEKGTKTLVEHYLKEVF